jgi:hypothetical protein
MTLRVALIRASIDEGRRFTVQDEHQVPTSTSITIAGLQWAALKLAEEGLKLGSMFTISVQVHFTNGVSLQSHEPDAVPVATPKVDVGVQKTPSSKEASV